MRRVRQSGAERVETPPPGVEIRLESAPVAGDREQQAALRIEPEATAGEAGVAERRDRKRGSRNSEITRLITGAVLYGIGVAVGALSDPGIYVGLGILIALFRNKETILADEVDLLKW